MTNNNNTHEPLKAQAELTISEQNNKLMLDCYNYLIRSTLKKSKRITDLSQAEANSKSAIRRKLIGSTTEERHDIVTSFILDKVLPFFESRKDKEYSHHTSTIVRMFENHLIDQYRHQQVENKHVSKLNDFTEEQQMDIINKASLTDMHAYTDYIWDITVEFRKTLSRDEKLIFAYLTFAGDDAKKRNMIPRICETLDIGRATFFNRLSNLKNKAESFVASKENV